MKSVCGLLVSTALALGAAEHASRGPLDPKGQIHIPIGLANSADTLKTFVEAEGNFSPGFGTYGIYFWIFDQSTKQFHSPTMDQAKCEHGLAEGGLLIPWSRWRAGPLEVMTEICQVSRPSPKGEVQVVGARVRLTNPSESQVRVSLLAGLRPLGAAGAPVREITEDDAEQSLLVDGHPALVACEETEAGFVAENDPADLQKFETAMHHGSAHSTNGTCSGILVISQFLEAGQSKTIGFVCPVLPGRRAAGHRWDGVSSWAQFDLNKPNPSEGGELQPDPGLAYYRSLKVADLFTAAAAYWSNLQQRVRLQLPDPRWAESFAAIVGHAALCLNEGAPDVAVVNYNVFNRDGMYMANIFQKSGNFELAEQAIDYFLRHPFNGRVQPEADNPGQILWIMGEHWQFTRDRRWLERVYPGTQKIAAMIRYYRTTAGPHWVWDTSLDFGEALPKDQRKELKPGACDGFNPGYTEAYDIAGLRAAIVLAEASGHREDATAWKKLADELFATYEQKFSAELPKGYGSYSVLWPCRLYPFGEGKAHEQFSKIGGQKQTSWRYFPLARAHQGLLAGNRSAAWQTLNSHLAHPQMQGWYALDEGGPSGVGGWHHVLTSWPIERNKDGSLKSTAAMPHGWATAEFQLLLRDALVFEDGDKLVLLSGVPPAWFKNAAVMKVEGMPTHFGACSFEYAPVPGGVTLALNTAAPGGCILRLPAELKAKVSIDSQTVSPSPNGDFLLPRGAKRATLKFSGYSTDN